MIDSRSPRLRGAALAVLALVLAPAATALPQLAERELSYDGRRAELVQQAVPRLAELARASKSLRLYGDADALWKKVLMLDPEHADARKALRFYKNRGDEWYQSKGYRRGKNRATKGLEETRALVDAELRALRDGLLIALDGRRPQLGRERVEDELMLLLELIPEDEALHGAMGEVNFEGLWLLEESVTAIKRRKAFPQLARACLELAPAPEEAEIREEERALELAWNAAKKTADLRVLGTTGVDEATHTARVSHAVGDYFRNVLAAERRHRDDFTIYMLQSVDKFRLLGAWPGLDAETRTGLQSADGGWLGSGRRLAEWSSNPARRIDGAARQTLGTLLMDTYGIDGRHGWAWEGMGLYMVHELVGTRLTWFFDLEGYQPQTTSGLWTSLQSPDADWFAAAERLLDAETAPGLVFLLGRKINAMREEDVLVSYVLAAYLLQGHPKHVPEILSRIGKGHHPVRVFEDELGYSMRTIELRLRRWLDETR